MAASGRASEGLEIPLTGTDAGQVAWHTSMISGKCVAPNSLTGVLLRLPESRAEHTLTYDQLVNAFAHDQPLDRRIERSLVRAGM